MMEIEFLDFYFPSESIGDSSVVDLDGEITTFVEASQLGIRWVITTTIGREFDEFGFFVANAVLGFLGASENWFLFRNLGKQQTER
jgi:hypothetical protein